MSDREWRDDFHQFMSVEPVEPPKAATEAICECVCCDLNPSAWRVFSKMALIHAVVGTLTLLFCPQFGIALLPGMGLMGLFMRFGEVGCMIGCGSIFLGSSMLVAAVMLRPEEVRVVRRTRALQLGLLGAMSVGALVCFGESTVITLAGAWLAGSLIGGLATLELGWLLRARWRSWA